jgi:hypothetical protein
MHTRSALVATSLAAVAGLSIAQSAVAQLGYGVNAAGSLFRFDLTAPNNAVTTLGPVGFVPEGLDFRPGTSTLYAIDVGPTTTQLYTINTTSGAATPVGTSFPSLSGVGAAGYDLTGAQSFGFDFNPTTLQADTSMRIRLVSSNGANLRLNSLTGQVAATDVALTYAAGDPNFGSAPRVDAAAYINSNNALAGGTTALYVLDFDRNAMALQNPPNNGTLNTVGSMGLSINAQDNIGFDILTAAADADPTIGGDSAYAVFRRPDAPLGGPLGAWLLYNVNLGTGATTGGALVGNLGGTPADFTGGFAVVIPAPGVGAGALLALGTIALGRRRTRVTAGA